MDIFTYVNSKFVYVARHSMLTQRVLKNALVLATQAPDDFVYFLMKCPGYMSIVAGEVMHVIKCVPMEVILRKDKEYYLQLPVTHENKTE